ncbi:UNVERIFIED_ORG: DHA2 family multidrug resistance protein-like MFS transporter [Methylobacterium sp. SuP10 SLI 274]|uniref:MFS transporter n=1 Tax=Methylorubrum extorquens TaxID=408 RepID=UPI00209F7F36|nr:MFS transporter [Methylorubrum extorquens]MDF9864629.1 DHA2 family multidrug resistance protein-like MFS transporter [Methylorubrum pseudosasae]MDH6638213.1 DHA2 family multidrug resistance protein-like MFS transporter [Methylobacterium sp. SuP10 SLI 274]MDH6667394.1 DHA2 family multidrug resistance protein-like MFS transporter [Methylorubrum zatmanii]MCP1559296.1 DHA2 family multidrug resistance protein-like MFS transporter [Methylorubrum extorquens]MDF9792939.1 DHA2 family multidrug resis
MTAQKAGVGSGDGLPLRERLLALCAMALAISMAVLDGAIVNVALPVIARDLDVPASEAIFVVSAYQIAVTAALLPLATLGEIWGYRRVYLAGLAVFTVASLACAVSPNLASLTAARVAQGLGAAGIMSVNIALVRFIYPSRLIGRGVGNVALIVAVASAAGPTVAAAILSVAAWPWLFLVNLPVGLVALAVGARTLPRTPRSARRFDLRSASLNALTVGLLIVGLDAFADPDTRGLAVAAIAAAVAVGIVFVRTQIRLAAPLLPLDLLRIPAFALSMVASICSFAAQMIAYVALPFYFHDALGFSETRTGFLMTPWPLAIAAMSPFAGRLADRVPPGLLGSLGLVLLAVGMAALALLPEAPATFDIVWRLTLSGIGFGLFQSPNNKVIITSAPRERSGGASGMQASARLVGQSLGAAWVAVLFGLVPGGPAGAFAVTLWCAVALALAGALASGLRRTGP